MIRITHVCKLFVSAFPLLIFMTIGLYTTINPDLYRLDVFFGKMDGQLLAGSGNLGIIFSSSWHSPWSISIPEFEVVDLESLGAKSLSGTKKRRLFFGANMPSFFSREYGSSMIVIPFWIFYGVGLIFVIWQGRLIFNRKMNKETQDI